MGNAEFEAPGETGKDTRMETGGISVGDLLRELDVGNSVAEYDASLEKYFVETSTFEALIRDGADIIAGDKGTGKTALFKILQQRYRSIDELATVEVLAAFNPTGNPVFQRLTEGDPLEEGQYVSIWKAYFLALVGNWLLEIFSEAPSDSLMELDGVLRDVGLRSEDDSPNTIFSQIVNLFRRLTNPKATELVVTPRPDGLPVVAGRIEFGDADPDKRDTVRDANFIRHDDALRLLNRALDELDITVWLVMDRLDEAFAGFPSAEIPALRALLRTYLDLNEFQRLRLKLFVRKDLFRRIIGTGFVNLTHVNARKVEILWDEDDLFDLLARRVKENERFVAGLALPNEDAETLFESIFPAQVDPGERKPKTWRWLMSRVRDGNGVRPPRNLIDLVQKAQEEQRRREQRSPTEYLPGRPIIGSEALKKGLARLSNERVEDTLLAEAGDWAYLIEKFRGAKAEQSYETIKTVLGVDDEHASDRIQTLLELGFLESVGTSFKVPLLYRSGLGITQGKAFSDEPADDDE